ncbi:MAG: type II toxin-antitoxin system VapC family toxin [Candidatus Jordarchaeales archaeon]
MTVIVVDASALAKVLLQEEGWEGVELTARTATLDHALIEALNAVWKAAILGKLGKDDAMERVEALKLISRGLLVFKAQEHFNRSMEIALAEKLTIYDAVYIALAEQLGTELQTSDTKQFYAAKKYVKAKLIK